MASLKPQNLCFWLNLSYPNTWSNLWIYQLISQSSHNLSMTIFTSLAINVQQCLKMLGLYLVGQNCLHLTFEQYLSSETYSSKYEKLPNIVILACKNITEKMHLLKMSGPQIWLCLFTFRPFALKQVNGLTTIDTIS